jgi:hypothetical protein
MEGQYSWYTMIGLERSLLETELTESEIRRGISQASRLSGLIFKCNELGSGLRSSCTAPKSRILLHLEKLSLQSLIAYLAKSSRRSTMVRWIFEALGQN